jgi:outer membrane protein
METSFTSGSVICQPRRCRCLGIVLLAALAGCTHNEVPVAALRDRILAPDGAAQASGGEAPADRQETLPKPRPTDSPETDRPSSTASSEATSESSSEFASLRKSDDFGCGPSFFTLDAAIAFALENNPRLRVARSAIDEALGNRQTAFAPFLPQATLYGTTFWGNNPTTPSGAFALPLPEYSDAPGYQTYQSAEFYLQWTLFDFGRREGRYNQSALRLDIAGLQAARADQTVVFDVAAAYYRVLFTQATRKVAEQAVREAESIAELTRNLLNGGVVTKDSMLRAEVQLSQDRQLLVAARSAESVALAGLNYAMGRNVSAATQVAEVDSEPTFTLSLAEGLQLAVDNRREFQVARKGIEIAQQGQRVAKAEFAPRIYAQGVISGESGHQTLTGMTETGAIIFQWHLFEGGARLGEDRAAGARTNAAVAQAQLVADTIAYEVNQAYYAVDDTRQRIVLARTAIAQAQENLRLIVNKYKAGDATPTDVVDAETAFTRAQQSYYTALYDYLTAIARLEYAMGTTAMGPGSASCHVAP